MRLHDGKATDASLPVFRERLWPSAAVFGFAILVTLSLGVAFAHAYTATIGAWVAAASSSAVVVMMTVTAPIVQVDDRGLQAGVAVLPWSAIGSVRRLDEVGTRDARGPRAHAAAYYLLRGWLPESVIVTVLDSEDPHPYWHISTRRAAELTAVLSAR